MIAGSADSVGQQHQGDPQSLPTLTKAHDAHSLTVEQAAQSYPVNLRVVVTYFDPYNDPKHPACFAADASGGIYIDLRSLPAISLKAGDFIVVKGISAKGGFAPIVIASEVHVMGKALLPSSAPRVTLTEIMTGVWDGQRVEVEGVVHAVSKSGENIHLVLALGDGEIVATTTRQAGAGYDSLVDAKVRLRGNAAPLFNQRGQMTGNYLIFPDRAQVTVEEPAPPHPMLSPVSPVSGLMSFTPDRPSGHRVHIRGVVTLYWPGRLLCIQDGLDGLCAQTDQSTPLSPGALADVIGFPFIGAFAPALAYATFEATGYQQPVTPIATTAAQALSGNHEAELVQVEGQVIGEDDSASDPNIVLSSGSYIFSAVLPSQSGVRALSRWQRGTTLKIVGICSVKSRTSRPADGFAMPRSFQILLRLPLDVVVIKSPSWWTARRAVFMLAAAVLLTFVVLVWVFVLRNQVFEQTQTIRQQLSDQKLSNIALTEQAEELSRQAAEIRILNEGLEGKIAQRTAQVQAANRDLEAFSYSVSHDLMAPLRHIAGFSNLLAQNLGPAISSEAREYLQIIQDSVRRMEQLVGALLSLARLGSQPLQVRPTPLNAVIDRVVALLQPECEGRAVEWHIARLPAVDCDAILMGQVFQNLLGNALKYSRGRAPAVIEVDSIQQPGKPAVIFVRDNGAGFDIQYAKKLFGVFQRMHTQSEFEGTGVGLATVQRIIQKHGGAIWADAKVEHGATFYFTVEGNDQAGL